MAINETIVTGRKFRKLIDEATKLWQRISFWGVATDVEFDDGENAETKFGAISGITDSLTSTSSNVAASAAAVKALNDKITELNSDLKIDWNNVDYESITSNPYTCSKDCCVIVTFSWTNKTESGYYKWVDITVGEHTETIKVHAANGTKTIKHVCRANDVVKISQRNYPGSELTGTVAIHDGYVLF